MTKLIVFEGYTIQKLSFKFPCIKMLVSSPISHNYTSLQQFVDNLTLRKHFQDPEWFLKQSDSDQAATVIHSL